MARALPVLGIDPEDTVLANAVLIISVRVNELLSWERYVTDPTRVYELHQMRIAAKRLRYTLEILSPVYEDGLDEAIDRVKRIQEHLGNIHDADVLVPELEQHLFRVLRPKKKRAIISSVEGEHFEAAAGLLALCRRKRDERADRYAKFLSSWQRLRDEAFFERLRAYVQRSAADESERLIEQRARERAEAAAAARPAPAGEDPGE